LDVQLVFGLLSVLGYLLGGAGREGVSLFEWIGF
jgi:hypothetical protein